MSSKCFSYPNCKCITLNQLLFVQNEVPRFLLLPVCKTSFKAQNVCSKNAYTYTFANKIMLSQKSKEKSVFILYIFFFYYFCQFHVVYF